MNTSERTMQLRLAAHISWAKTADRSARTAAARKASHHTRFLAKAREMHPDATEAQIEKAAESLRKAHYSELARKSAQARRIKRELAQKDKARRIERELAEARSGSAA